MQRVAMDCSSCHITQMTDTLDCQLSAQVQFFMQANQSSAECCILILLEIGTAVPDDELSILVCALAIMVILSCC